MSSRSFKKGTGWLLLLALVISAAAFAKGASGELIGSLEFQNDLYFVTSRSTSGGNVELDVTLRTGLSRNMVAMIEAELDPPAGWSITTPPPIYLQPMEEVTFPVIVEAPPGEGAGSRCTVTLTAVKEDGGVVGSDSCIVEVLPTTDLTLLPTEDVFVDRPLAGDLELSLTNTGNVPVSWTLDPGSEVISGARTPLMAPNEELALRLPYSFPESADRLEMSIFISPSGHSNVLFVQMVRESDRLHIIFGIGPRLFLAPSIDKEGASVTVLVLGGKVKNIGVEAVDAGNGSTVGSEVLPEADELDRHTFLLEGRGFEGSRRFTVRAFGFVDGRRMTSNQVRTVVEGEPGRQGFRVTAPAVAGGVSGGLSIIAGSAAYLYAASETFRWRWLLVTVIPLYSLIKEDKVLDHFFRGRLFEFIRSNPGITYTALKDHFEVNNGTLTYHLLKLEREGLLVHRNMGRYKLFYAEGVRIKGCEIVVSPLDMEMLTIIGRTPGITASELFGSISSTRSHRTMSRHLKQMQRKGFIDVRPTGVGRRLYLSGGEHSFLNQERGVIEMTDLAMRTA